MKYNCILTTTIARGDNLQRQNAPNPWLQPTAYTRREQWYLAGVSPFAGRRAWPVTGGG
jgi:hypothetical protein